MEEDGINLTLCEYFDEFTELAFVKKIGLVIETAESIEEFKKINLPEGNFFVRVIDSNNCHDTSSEKIIGENLGGKGRISFSNPDFVVLAFHLKKWYITIQVFERNTKENSQRRAPLRPFFSPISMDPLFASFVLNLGGFRKGDAILDPFCGGGGILIEAHKKGLKVYGLDILQEMVVGARTNLKYYGSRDFNIQRADFLNFNSDFKFDGIATDLPYGRNSHLPDRTNNFLKNTSLAMYRNITKGARACIVTNNIENLEFFKEEFFLDKVFPVRVHKSLTRYYSRLIRK